MELKPGYKQTEVGVIPEDWNVDKIKYHAQITTGSRNTQDRIESGSYPFFVRSQKVERINSYSFDGEAVLTAGDGVGTGKVFHYINGKFDFHQRVYKISNFSPTLDGYYFYLYFSNHFYNRISQMTAKSSVDSVRMEMIADMQIPMPPTKAEQTAIANALSDADALIQSLTRLIAKKRQIKQGTMQTLLNPYENGRLKAGWVVKRLGELCSSSSVRINPRIEKKIYKCIELEHIDQGSGRLLGHVSSNNQLSQKTLFKKGDVLFGKLRPYLKKYLFAEFDGACSTEIWVLKSENNVSSLWLYYLVQSDQIVEAANQSTGTKMPRAEWRVVKNTEINFPSSLNEQTRIATTLSDMDAEIAALETKLAKYRQIKQGMMQNLLTGRIRLVKLGSNTGAVA